MHYAPLRYAYNLPINPMVSLAPPFFSNDPSEYPSLSNLKRAIEDDGYQQCTAERTRSPFIVILNRSPGSDRISTVKIDTNTVHQRSYRHNHERARRDKRKLRTRSRRKVHERNSDGADVDGKLKLPFR